MPLNKIETEQLKKLFIECCKIDNPSKKEEKIADWINKKIKKLGFKTRIDKNNNVFFAIKGQKEKESLLLNAHLDGVQPCIGKEPMFDGKKFYSKKETILGADNATGLISILFALEYLKKNKIKHKPLEILFTTMEEIGGIGIKNFNFSIVNSNEAVTIDSLANVGSIVTKSPSKYNFSISFEGISIHGQGADKGISAIKMMAELISSLPIGKVKENVFLNIGIIKGGKSLNTVAGKANIEGNFKIHSEGEIRAEKNNDAKTLIDTIYKKIERLEKKYKKGSIKFICKLNRPSYNFSSEDTHLKNIKKAINRTDIKSKEIESFGVSDANTLNSMGVKTFLLGTGVKNAHTTKETVTLKSLVKLTEIVIELCKQE